MPPHCPLDPAADDPKLLAQIVAYYHTTLTQTPDALNQLRSRGVTSSQAVEHFTIGYSDRTLGTKLPSNQSKLGKAIRSRLLALGIYLPSAHEAYAGSITIPIYAADGSGRIVDLYGRKLTPGYRLRKGTTLELHLPGDHKGVFNVQALAASEEIILCTSPFDALTFWCQGYRNITCTFGPDALTADHLAAFAEFRVERVLTFTDAITDKLTSAGIECFLLRLPPGMDVVSYAQQAKDAADALGAVLRKAEWLGKGKAPAVPTVELAKDVEPEQPTPEPAVESNATIEPDITEPLPAPPIESNAVEPEIAATTPERSASPLPPPPADLDAEVSDDEVTIAFGNRRYRVRGWCKNLSFDQMRVNVLVSNDAGMFVDTFDLYAAKYRRAFIAQAAEELGMEQTVVKKDLGRVLLKVEELHDQHLAQELQPKNPVPTMTDGEREQAMHLLHDPHLLDRIAADVAVVGEATNKLVAYLAVVSRKLDQPLAVVIQSTSAAGKSALMDAVLDLVPPEDLVKFSAMTGQSLYYMGDGNIRHKILAIVEEEGAERASYALKLLQSEGELRIASTGKDSGTGRLTTQEYKVQGPVMLFLTTTSTKLDEELLNRCLVLTVDEGREQTKAIHQVQRQRQAIESLLGGQQREQTLALHRNAQRLLRPVLVANPHAHRLTFLDDKVRTRRDHVKYLTLIRAVTLLRQYQRPTRTIEHQGKLVEYIEVTEEDIDVANRLIADVLSRCLDELPPQTRRLLMLIDAMVTTLSASKGIDRADYRFSRRQVREYTGWGHSQIAVHLQRLEAMEYLVAHRSRHGKSYLYELAYAPPHDELPLLSRLFGVLNQQRNGHLPGSKG